MIEWLQKNKEFLNIKAIEQAIKCPNDTLRKALSGRQKLPNKWESPLKSFISGFGFIEVGTRRTDMDHKEPVKKTFMDLQPNDFIFHRNSKSIWSACRVRSRPWTWTQVGIQIEGNSFPLVLHVDDDCNYLTGRRNSSVNFWTVEQPENSTIRKSGNHHKYEAYFLDDDFYLDFSSTVEEDIDYAKNIK